MPASLSAFETALGRTAARIDDVLGTCLTEAARPGETVRPARLMAAMRHGALGGGKRLRPFLLVESARLFACEGAHVDRLAAALECVHCYSLVHDDLPAMDDDALRRGRPTVHVAFDEATAILAGDALLTLAFDLVAEDAPAGLVPASARLELVGMLARSAGPGGMVGGQVLDLAAESETPDAGGVRTLQAMKTGALIRFACEAGAVAAGAPAADRERMARFGAAIGSAFQLADDLLDVTADTATLGKAAGKDAGRGKATLVGLNGIDWARAELDRLTEAAADTLAPYGARADSLVAAARFVAARRR